MSSFFIEIIPGRSDVMLDPFDEMMIKNYIDLTAVLKNLAEYKKQVRNVFYFQNMATRITYQRLTRKTNEMIVEGFRPDREVEKLLLNQERIDNRIERCLFRKKHFSYFLESLSMTERYLLEERFKYDKDITCSQKLIDQVLDEINEIEIAICYREGIDQSEFEECETFEDVEINLKKVCDFFAL